MLGCGDDEDKRALREKVAVLERRVAELERAKSNEELELGWLRQEQCTQEGLQQPPPPPAAAGSFPIPPSFKCPITGSMMQDPVVDPEGNTYERRAIEAWLERSQTSPMTRTSLTASMLNSNRALRDAIESFRQMTGSPGARQPVAPQVLRPEEERWAEAETAVCARTLSRAACQCPPAASSIAPLFALFYFSALPPPLSLLLCVCPAPAAGPSALGLVPLEDLLMFIFPFYPV